MIDYNRLVNRSFDPPEATEPSVRFDSRHYSIRLFTNPQQVIEDYLARLAKLPSHDTLIGTGVSGAAAVGMLALASDKLFAVVRKPNDHAHSTNLVEGRVGRRWLFVDDFISFGRTRDRVKEAVQMHQEIKTEYVGAWLYTHDEFEPSTRSVWGPSDPVMGLGALEPSTRSA